MLEKLDFQMLIPQYLISVHTRIVPNLQFHLLGIFDSQNQCYPGTSCTMYLHTKHDYWSKIQIGNQIENSTTHKDLNFV